MPETMTLQGQTPLRDDDTLNVVVTLRVNPTFMDVNRRYLAMVEEYYVASTSEPYGSVRVTTYGAAIAGRLRKLKVSAGLHECGSLPCAHLKTQEVPERV